MYVPRKHVICKDLRTILNQSSGGKRVAAEAAPPLPQSAARLCSTGSGMARRSVSVNSEP